MRNLTRLPLYNSAVQSASSNSIKMYRSYGQNALNVVEMKVRKNYTARGWGHVFIKAKKAALDTPVHVNDSIVRNLQGAEFHSSKTTNLYLWGPEHHNRVHKCLLGSFLSHFNSFRNFTSYSLNPVLISSSHLHACFSQVVLPRGLTTTTCVRVRVPRVSYTSWPLYSYRCIDEDYTPRNSSSPMFSLLFTLLHPLRFKFSRRFFFPNIRSLGFFLESVRPTRLSWNKAENVTKSGNSSCDLLSFNPLQAHYWILQDLVSCGYHRRLHYWEQPETDLWHKR
jgi:hypothetical protein